MTSPIPHSEHDNEFAPLPYYTWAERPIAVPLTKEECATAIHLQHGDITKAAEALKVSTVRLDRFIRGSPYLRSIYGESMREVLHKAVGVPIQTLFDPTSDARRLEWAFAQVIRSRLAMDHVLAPAPVGSSSVVINQESQEITIHWGEPPLAIDSASVSDQSGSTEVSDEGHRGSD